MTEIPAEGEWEEDAGTGAAAAERKRELALERERQASAAAAAAASATPQQKVLDPAPRALGHASSLGWANKKSHDLNRRRHSWRVA